MICFHHSDLDGRAAGAVVYSKFPDCRFFEINYDIPVPFHEIFKDELVYIVDFSFKEHDMSKLFGITKNIVWIDHHKTILDHQFNISEINGIRSTEWSGAYLTWKYLNREIEVPVSIKLISDYDTWQLRLARSKEFRFGMDLLDQGPTSKTWKPLLENYPVPLIVHICEKGKTCLEFIDRIGDDYCKQFGFDTEFEGYRCFAQGVYRFGFDFFGDRIDKYDICICFEFNGENFVISMYSKEVDVSVIATKYGKKYGLSGGGHKKAAGFVSPELPFKKSNKQ